MSAPLFKIILLPLPPQKIEIKTELLTENTFYSTSVSPHFEEWNEDILNLAYLLLFFFHAPVWEPRQVRW